MHFGKKVIFMLAGLGTAVITQPIGPLKIAIYRKNVLHKRIAEKRARVAWLEKDIRRTLLAEWYEPMLTERLIVKQFPGLDFWQRTKKFLSFGNPIL
jgi:hypothetical protein